MEGILHELQHGLRNILTKVYGNNYYSKYYYRYQQTRFLGWEMNSVVKHYKLKDFAKWARKVGLSDELLTTVVSDMDRGLIGDRLGAHVYKKRIKIAGRGKRGGARAVVLFKYREVTLFLYGFLKNEQSNISESEEKQLRIFATEFLRLTQSEREQLCTIGKLIELRG